MERRKHPRNFKDIEVKFSIEGKTLKCSMQNQSESGALFKIDITENDKITQDDIGKEATIEFKNSKKQKLKGRIIRLIDEEDVKYFAVFFLKQ